MRRMLGAVTAAALLALTATGCATAVAGQGSFDAAGGPLSTGGPSPTGSPTDSPTDDPTDDPTGTPTGDPTGTPTGGPAGADQEAVAAVAERWYHALGERDGDTACGLMTESAQRQAGSDCEEAVRDTDFTTAQREAMRRIEVDPGQVQVTGDDARIPASAFSVDGRQSGSSGRLVAARTGGQWLINGVG